MPTWDRHAWFKVSGPHAQNRHGTDLGQASFVPGAGSAAARICREAGATIAPNVRLRDLRVDAAWQDEHCIDVIAGPQVARVRRAKERTYPELRQSARCKLVCRPRSRARWPLEH